MIPSEAAATAEYWRLRSSTVHPTFQPTGLVERRGSAAWVANGPSSRTTSEPIAKSQPTWLLLCIAGSDPKISLDSINSNCEAVFQQEIL
jgi:hypothetical protein